MNAALESWTGLFLADPAWLALLLLLPFVLWPRRGAPRLPFAPLALLEGPGENLPPRTWRVRLAPVPRGLEAVALALAIFALARPVEREVLPEEREGVDILLVLDVSSSMDARDLDPLNSRLALARSAAARFVAARPEDRIGIVTFARYPDLVSPPTLDRRALADFLERIERVEPDGPEDATGIGTALALAVRLLAGGAPVEGAPPRVVILLSDGEENVAGPRAPREIAPEAAAQLAARAGVRVHAIAMGLGEPDGAGGWRALDTGGLRRIAHTSGGRFFEAREAGALGDIYDAIDTLETQARAEPRFALHDRFAPFLLLALALVAAAALLRRGPLEVWP